MCSYSSEREFIVDLCPVLRIFPPLHFRTKGCTFCRVVIYCQNRVEEPGLESCYVDTIFPKKAASQSGAFRNSGHVSLLLLDRKGPTVFH
jgi:hypothetical protein